MKISRSLPYRLLLAFATCTLAACPQQVRFKEQVNNPKVAFMQDGEAVLAYQVVTEGVIERRGGMRLERYSDASVSLTGRTDFAQGDEQHATSVPIAYNALAADGSGTAVSIHASNLLAPQSGTTSGSSGCRLTLAPPTPWSCSTVLSTTEEGELAVAMDGHGGVLALVEIDGDPDAPDDPRFLQSVTRSPSGEWSRPQSVADSMGTNASGGTRPAVVYASSGIGHALYQARDGSIATRRYVAATDGWEAPLSVASAAELTLQGHLVLHRDAPNAAPMAVWADAAAAPSHLHAARYAGSGAPGWTRTAPIPGSDCVNDLDVAMAANGDVLVVWRCDLSVDRHRYFASRYSNGAWSAAAQEIGRVDGDAGPVKVAVDAQGNGVAVWRDATTLRSARLVLTEGWQAPEFLGEVTERLISQDEYSVALDDPGRGLVVWVRNAGQTEADGTMLGWQRVGLATPGLAAPRYVFAGDSVELTVSVATPQSAATTVELTSTFAAGVLSLPASVTLPAGQREVRLNVRTSAGDPRASGRIRASINGVGQSVDLGLMPEPVLQVHLAPAAITGGQSSVLTVSASERFPVPLTLALASDNAAAPVPASLVVPANAPGASSTLVTATTLAALNVSITASTRMSRASAALRIDPTPGGAVFLNVAVSGNGRVTSNPAGIDCGADCSEGYALNTQVTLTATPASGARFFEWAGDPDCADGSVRMDLPKTCTAIFIASGVGWQQYATGLDPNGAALQKPALALDAGNAAVLAYSERGSNGVSRIVLRRTLAIQSGSWETIGTPLGGGATDASQPALAIDSAGNLLVAWSEGNGVRQNIYLARYNVATQQFEALGTSAAPLNFFVNSRATQPALALRQGDLPVLAWIEDGFPVVKVFDGTAWVPHAAGAGPAVANDVDQLRLALLGDGTPLLAWLNRTGTGTVSVARGDAGGWLALGPALSGPEPAAQPDVRDLGLGVDAGGQPVVAWVQGADRAYVTYARIYGAGNWQPFGVTSPPANTAAGLVSFAFVLSPGQPPTVVVIESQSAGPFLVWARYIATGWVPQGGASTNVSLLNRLSLAIPHGNAAFDSPVVAGSRVTSIVSTEVAAWRYFP